MKYCVICKKDKVSMDIKNKLIEKFGKESYDEVKPDFCFPIGGDGTYLNAVHKYIDNIDNISFVNIKTGNIGFYSNMEASEVDNIENIINKNNEYVYHDLLEFSIDNGKCYYAVNEVALYGVPEAFKLEVYVDGNKLEDFSGTGLVISTPTGSTGLNKSLNGAIIDEKLKTLQLTEIAGIKNTKYNSIGNAVVLDSSREIEIRLKDEVEHILVSYDNRSIDMKGFKSIKIKYSKKQVKNIKYIKKDFFERVQKSFL